MIDLRVGGPFHLDMVQESTGARFPLRYEIVELVAPELIVLRSGPMPEMGMREPVFTRVELRHDGRSTRITLTDGPYPASGGAEQGWNASFSRLEELLR